MAGLQPSRQDFILGTREIDFKSLEDFEKYIRVNEGNEIALHVYNTNDEKVREVLLTPNKGWGGNGLLGCNVSFGLFNKIPLRKLDIERMNYPEGHIISLEEGE